jgi:hypothetical protein
MDVAAYVPAADLWASSAEGKDSGSKTPLKTYVDGEMGNGIPRAAGDAAQRAVFP